MADDDPFASIAKPIAATPEAQPDADPFAAIAKPVAAPAEAPEPGIRDQIESAINDPSNVPDTGWRGTVEKFGQGAAQGLAAPFLHPIKTAQSMLESTPPGMIYDAVTGKENPGQTMGRAAMENPAGTAGQIAGGAILSHVVGGAAGAAARVAKGPPLVPGENFTADQHASLAAVLARGSGAGKAFFPKEAASATGSVLRQTAADNPAMAKVAATGSPEDSLAATQAIHDAAIKKIDVAHQQALKPVANTPINPKPIQDAVSFPKSLEDFAPEDAEAVKGFRDRLGKVTTLQGLNDLRVYLNTELQSMFKKNAVAAGSGGALEQGMKDALSATRNQYYQELEKATGQSFQKTKRLESNLLSSQEALGNAAPGLAAKQAIAEQPRSLRGHAADALQGAHTVAGSPVAGVAKLAAQKVLGETPMTPIQEGLHHFFSKLPDPSPVQAASQAPRLASVQPRLNPPAPPQLNAPQTPQTQTSMFRGQPMVGRPAPASVAPGPQTPQLGAGEGNPQYVTPPASPPPPVNAPTAVLNPNAGTPRPQGEIIPPRKFNVGQDGQAAIQRPALPPPETHAFSQKAWKAANPKGDVKAALARAKAKGYRVVD